MCRTWILQLLILALPLTACGNEEEYPDYNGGTDTENPSGGNETGDSSDGNESEGGWRSFLTSDPGVENRVYATVDGAAAMEGRVYLWQEDNMPDRTHPTGNGGNPYADPQGFRPFLEVFTAAEGTTPKGAVILCAGGAFQFRANHSDTYPTMRRLVLRGYQVFVLQYRLRPWTMQEGSLDLARAIRYVRAHADEYRIHPDNIATAGYSAGGIQCGDEAWHYGGTVDGTALDENYRPDALDRINADPFAVGMIYSFYGRLSVASQDVEGMRAAGLPPTFFSYGTRDPFYEQFNINVRCLQEAGIPVEAHVLQDYPHGYGAGGNDEVWIDDFDRFLERYMNKD